LGLCGIFIAGKLPKETGFIVFPVSTSITSLVAFTLILFLIFQFTKKKEVIEKLSREELEKALYECVVIREEISKVWQHGKPTGELYNKSWEIARKIIPNLKRLKEYRAFLQENFGISYAINLFEKLWDHYSGGKRVETKGPYKEMGKNLIRLFDELCAVLRRYKRLNS